MTALQEGGLHPEGGSSHSIPLDQLHSILRNALDSRIILHSTRGRMASRPEEDHASIWRSQTDPGSKFPQARHSLWKGKQEPETRSLGFAAAPRAKLSVPGLIWSQVLGQGRGENTLFCLPWSSRPFFKVFGARQREQQARNKLPGVGDPKTDFRRYSGLSVAV